MKTINLTQGKVTIVDDEDFEYLNQWKWYYNGKYATRVKYVPQTKRIFMHRVVASTPIDLICDHINHDTLDNRKQNLRNVTNLQNQMNRKGNCRAVLGIKNISLTPSGTFRVHIRLHGKTIFRKTFKSLDDAITVRNEMQEKYHGEFSYKGDY